jgi:hypothetical protein
VAAAKLVFSYAAGKPTPAADPDTLDAHELATRRGNVASAEDMKALFEACPAWMPDLTGSDRTPHAFADVLRCTRQSLLDALAGADAGPRQSVPITESKRVKRPAAVAQT